MAANTTRTPAVIGLTGPAGSGKDTMADYLVWSWGFKKVSFAGPLKRAVVELYGLDPDVFEDRIAKERVVPHWEQSPRHMAQWLGTDVMRSHYDVSFFLRRLDLSIDKVRDFDSRRVVVTDVRFDNEAEYIRDKWHGQVWKIDAGDRLVQKQTSGEGLDSEARAHASENGVSARLVNCNVDNSGTVQTAYDELDNHLMGVDNF